MQNDTGWVRNRIVEIPYSSMRQYNALRFEIYPLDKAFHFRVKTAGGLIFDSAGVNPKGHVDAFAAQLAANRWLARQRQAGRA